MNSRDGMALMVALWMLVILSVVSLDVTVRLRASSESLIHTVERVRLRQAALGGIELLAISLRPEVGSLGLPGERDPGGELPTRLLDGVRISGFVERPADRLHLNRATAAELQELMLALRVDARAAARAANRIADWRDRDRDPRPDGAERAAYLAADAPRLPADGEFRDVAELRSVLGLPASLVDRLLPYITIEGSGRLDLWSAPAPVLAALPGIDLPLAGEIVSRRREGRSVASAAELVGVIPQEHMGALLLRTVTGSHERVLVVTAQQPGHAASVTIAAEVVLQPIGMPAVIGRRERW